ncbi:MAG TPA: hypothetical protein VKY51_08050 [Fredinandcohnia sp.]|nr:hypothetical protein [Fredinandcohnia sp.]
MIRKLVVVAMGKAPRGLLEAAGAKASQAFALEPVFGVGLADPTYAYNPQRGQYHAAAILRKLTKVRKDDEIVLGVGTFSLFDPDEETLIVDGDRDARTAVLGSAYVDGGRPERLLDRVAHAAVVGVGKALGLRECHDPRCAMASISHPSNLDKRTGRLCAMCEVNFAKGDKAWAR